MGKPYLTASEAAVVLKMTPRRVRQLRDTLGGIRVGPIWVFDAGYIVDYSRLPRPKRGPVPGRKRAG